MRSQFSAILLLIGLLPVLARAAEPALDPDRFKDVASELRCPTCVGLSVLESDAPFSKQIKDEVASQLKAGKSNDEILTWFTERYGPWILRVPPKTGVNVLAWAIPLGALIAGPFLLWFFVWRRREAVDLSEGVKPLSELLKDWEGDLARVRQRQSGGAP